jgi:hypothetical protein
LKENLMCTQLPLQFKYVKDSNNLLKRPNLSIPIKRRIVKPVFLKSSGSGRKRVML